MRRREFNAAVAGAVAASALGCTKKKPPVAAGSVVPSEGADETMEYVEANGIRFAYLEEGEGPLVLLLHGFPDTAHTWDDVRPKIAAKGYRAVSPFTRGYYPTGIPAEDATPETRVQDALALITALGAEDAIVIGHDWGAYAAYGAAALDSKRVKKVITVSIPHPAGIKATPGKVWGVRHFFSYKRRGAAKRFARNDFAALPLIYKRWSPAWSPGPDEFKDVRACFAHPGSLDAAFGYYRTNTIRTPSFLKIPIDVPGVAFAGLDDGITEPSDYYGGKRAFTKEYVVEEVRGGHFLHREHPDAFAERLLTHL